MRWYLTGPSMTLMAAAISVFRHRLMWPPENRTRSLMPAAVLFVIAVGVVILDVIMGR
jgi:hypothetical protein